MSRRIALLLLLVAACKDSSAYEYYDLRGEVAEYECGCGYDSQPAEIEPCIEQRRSSWEREQQCAIDYVEDSRKNLKRVEPIYSCLADRYREYVDCLPPLAECHEGDSCSLTSPEMACTVRHLGENLEPDDALRGMQAIGECARPDEESTGD